MRTSRYRAMMSPDCNHNHELEIDTWQNIKVGIQ